MNKELMGALDELEREKNISKETLLDAIEQSLIQAYKNHFGKADNVHVTINRETGDFSVFADRTVVEFVDDPAEEISLVEAQKQNTNAEIGDIIKVPIHSDKFGRIATQAILRSTLFTCMNRACFAGRQFPFCVQFPRQ